MLMMIHLFRCRFFIRVISTCIVHRSSFPERKRISGLKAFLCPVINSAEKQVRWFQTIMAAQLSPEVKAKLDKIPDVRIDETGKFKYILIKVFVTDSDGKHVDTNSKVVVRGRADCPYHGDIFDKFQEETAKLNLEGIDDDILGGGRILREGNKITVFGYSQGYGQADHSLTVEIIKRHYPSHEITWNNDGY